MAFPAGHLNVRRRGWSTAVQRMLMEYWRVWGIKGVCFAWAGYREGSAPPSQLVAAPAGLRGRPFPAGAVDLSRVISKQNGE